MKKKKGVLIWHPNIHERFYESLFYFMLRYKGYRREYLETLKRELLNQGISGICIYEVFGAFDIVLRAWLTTNMLSEITKIFEKTNSLISYPYFRVKKVSHWGFLEEPEQNMVDNLINNPEKITQVQQAVNSGNVEAGNPYFESSPKLAFFDKYADNWVSVAKVKFYSALTFGQTGEITKVQENNIYETLVKIREDIQKKKGAEDYYFSIYMGENFAHVMIKGVVNNLLEARDLIVKDVIGPLEAYFPESTTFAICEKEPSESDDISEEALKASSWGTPPQWITSWFPNFFHLGGERSKVSHINSLLTDHRETINSIPKEYLISILQPLLESVIRENPDRAVEDITPWFSQVEAKLSDNEFWYSFLSNLSKTEGAEWNKVNANVLKNADVNPNRELTLIDFINKYLWAIRMYKSDANEILVKTHVQAIANVRNDFAHGRIYRKLNDTWPTIFEQLMWFIPFYLLVLRLGSSTYYKTRQEIGDI